jgi:two-component system sensor histidine kinase PhoQ
MDRIVQHQLQRAIAGSATGIANPVPVLPAAEKVKASLAKLHRDKGIDIGMEVEATVVFRGAEGDLLEILGNLLDNACKWCQRDVHLFARRRETGLELRIEDDGPGIDPALAERLLERGVRADEAVAGHGIGLAMVRDIAAAYGGGIVIERSRLGGAAIVVCIPD